MAGNLTIPNILTIFRIVLTPIFVITFVSKKIFFSLIIFFVAGITDALDGFIARFFNQKSTLGAILDPLADKILLMTAYVCLGIVYWVPSWLTVIVVSRDILIIGGLAFLNFMGQNIKSKIKPSFLSKINTLFQLFLVLVVLSHKSEVLSFSIFFDYYIYLCVLVAVLTVASGIDYIIKGANYLLLMNGEKI
ncbi:CDP-diacylglycerol--glycerol-3-phosphate 3-phosphatidyltransferase [Desulfonauticus submarinus]|uniref:CDP-diacylglycerol--glycerol-3-phosphate 3-phosphatidyltransferase n=1 Tax=Desulfonauticus submarinus TaxID=206665 RepID=A0A1H0EAL8_9BACT|nr:CDP-diacylglycerol--glycerol-3-phosphate 3-phosphatidyltransferase [Desulfonauticus submarinus]SDN79358.1 CDP-diacylglycerol--glycerol-3-phosphate 3-phosphatidyltransferase [Desulfonauticus submarinus]